MKIRCNLCGKSVSTEVPSTTVIRAWIECPECTESKKPAGYIFEDRFYKTLDELRGRTMGEEFQPVPVYV